MSRTQPGMTFARGEAREAFAALALPLRLPRHIKLRARFALYGGESLDLRTQRGRQVIQMEHHAATLTGG